MKKTNILGINISNLTKEEILNKIREYLNQEKQHYIVTPNPEIILAAQHDEELFYILNNADISVLDGFGLKLGALSSGVNIQRITGADLIKDIFHIAEEQQKKILILNWQGGLSTSEEIEKSIKKIYPNISLSVMDIDREGKVIDYSKVKEICPNILVTTAGAPFQEKIIFQALKKIPTAKLGIGIGGALDFLTCAVRRAPKIMRQIGLEWLWRLIKQPKRITRIYNAVIVFTIKFLIWKYILPFFYRQNVACFLFKKENNRYRVLVVERLERYNHWQLPQGGTDCQDIVTAGARELREEINCDKFKTLAGFKNLWKYEFGKVYPGKYGYDSGKSWGYKGQRQGLLIAEFLGDDNCIKVNYWEHKNWKWVDVDILLDVVHSVRKDSVKIYLEKFKEYLAGNI